MMHHGSDLCMEPIVSPAASLPMPLTIGSHHQGSVKGRHLCRCVHSREHANMSGPPLGPWTDFMHEGPDRRLS